MFSDEELNVFIQKLEKKGYNKVQKDFINSKYNGKHKKTVENWLKKKEDEKEENYKILVLEVAEEANRIAISSRNASWMGIIISIIAIIVSIYFTC